MIPRSVHASVEASRAAPDFAINEDDGRLLVAGTLSREALLAWQDISNAGVPWLSLRCIDASGDEVQPEAVQDGDRVRLTMSHSSADGAAYFFTPEGWRYFLFDDARVGGATIVNLAFVGVDETFSARAFPIEQWLDAPQGASKPKPRAEAGPRRLVRSQSPDLMAPTRIEPFIAVTSALTLGSHCRFRTHLVALCGTTAGSPKSGLARRCCSGIWRRERRRRSLPRRCSLQFRRLHLCRDRRYGRRVDDDRRFDQRHPRAIGR